jgi:hypothetical protein
LSRSDDVVLVKVDSVRQGDFSTATFSIQEVLKGRSHGPLVLTSEFVKFKPGEEYVLCWMGAASNKGMVDPGFLDGIPEWFCLQVAIEGGKPTVLGIGTLDQVKALLATKQM